MSWRVEHAHPLALLRELPDELVQTTLLRPPRELSNPDLLAILGELRRVTRADGTLWLAVSAQATEGARLSSAKDAGWLLAEDAGAGVGRGVNALGRRPVRLLAKTSAFHFIPRAPLPRARIFEERPRTQPLARRSALARQSRRVACVPSGAGHLTPALIEWCIKTTTSPLACVACGAAWRRLPGAQTAPGRWTASCEHGIARGRCLVLDPFCGLAQTGVLALRAGRSFLGVESDLATARRASARIISDRLERAR